MLDHCRQFCSNVYGVLAALAVASMLDLGRSFHRVRKHTHTHTHTRAFNGSFSRTTRVGRYQKCKTNLDFTEARDSEWRWHQLGICKSAPRSRQNNHTSTSPLSFLQAGCPSCRPTNSVEALKAQRVRKTQGNLMNGHLVVLCESEFQ